MTMLGKLDRLVYATGLERMIFMKFRPRSFRWTPLLVIAALIAGYVLMARTQTVLRPGFLSGLMIFYGAYLAAFFVRIFGPRLLPSLVHPLDERELMIRARAYAVSGVMLGTLAMLGCFYMAVAALFGLWHPQLPFDWVNLGFGLQAAGMLLPTFIASWLQPRPADDHEA